MSDLDDRLNDAVTRSANALLRHVVHLFNIPPGKRPTLVGTSLLVQRAETYYLISARHVIDYASNPGGLHYYIEPGRLHRLIGAVLRTQAYPGVLDVDTYDISIVKLPADAHPPGVAVWKLPLPFTSLAPFSFPRAEKQYLVTGFPKSRSRANPHNRRLTSEPSGFRVISSKLSSYQSLGLKEDHHLVLNLDIENMHFPDGAIRQIADPHGMSGSPVWLLFDEDGENRHDATPVVGIAIEYHRKEKLLVATDIAIAVHLINDSDAA